MAARIAITGLGVVSPVGLHVSAFWSALLAGTSGVSLIDGFPTDRLRSDIAAQVRGLDASGVLDDKEQALHGRVTKMLLVASAEAIAQADLGAADGDRVGVLLGTGQGAVELMEENFVRVAARGVRSVSPFFIPAVMPNAASALLSIKRGFRGPSFTLASACATGAHAIAIGALLVASGEADAMVVGGGEAAIVPTCVAGFGNARALARSGGGDPARASRPYDLDRSGFVMGEGAGAMVLESEEHARGRGAAILAYLSGWGMTSDAEHLARPHPEGRGVRDAVIAALRRAGATPADIGYINPHATSTPQGDVAEYKALAAALGPALARIPVSATKSMIGHLLGGAGVVEAVATVCSLRDGAIHPSINLDHQDPQFELDVARTRRDLRIDRALKISAGFGGHNVALLFDRR